jgi:hypothetical protein
VHTERRTRFFHESCIVIAFFTPKAVVQMCHGDPAEWRLTTNLHQTVHHRHAVSATGDRKQHPLP